MKDWSTNSKRDLAFGALTFFVLLGIWSPAWEAPLWQTIPFYLIAIVFLVPAVKNVRETGMDTMANALIPGICIGLMMLGAIGHFVWEFFLRY